ncbi:cytochrome P450 [Colletotrichum godetiae]|uniref:Cytochrome P450 n=1 Tax=Colletotrichum godetiae TaxID=1209918 RepID=A0AAJ0AJH6_9PEZI|nr:cytochrome P450 [Colletotrichum godetiae]KAK1675048.1 cytochrome P450 [Colletotrichum godetiae]
METQIAQTGWKVPSFQVTAIITAFLCLLIIPLIYNVLFHPLARVPGPFLAKFNDFWHAYQLYTDMRHEKLCKLHDQYGPVLRLGPNTVSVNTTEGFQKVYSATSPIDKSPFYQSFTPGFQSSFSSMGAAYKEKKSILSQAFSQKKLDAMEPAFMEHIWKLCKVMKSQSEVNLDDTLSALTVDILSDVCFGETFDLLHNPMEKAKEGTLWRWPLLQQMIRKFSYACTTRGYPAKLAIDAMIKQRQSPSGKHDIFNYLLTATSPTTGVPFPDRELFGEAIVMFVAGSDTTSTALLTILWHLLAHKNAYDKLVSEIRSTVTRRDELSYHKIQHLPYLRAVIEEGMRIFPPNSGFIPRQVLQSDGAFVLHGVPLPVGTEVGVANMAMHRNPEYFERPNCFIPERWIGDGQSAVKDKSAFSPFSKGPRACLGRTMAYMEMSLVLAAVSLEMDLEFQDPEFEARQGYTATDSFVLTIGLVHKTVTKGLSSSRSWLKRREQFRLKESISFTPADQITDTRLGPECPRWAMIDFLGD